MYTATIYFFFIITLYDYGERIFSLLLQWKMKIKKIIFISPIWDRTHKEPVPRFSFALSRPISYKLFFLLFSSFISFVFGSSRFVVHTPRCVTQTSYTKHQAVCEKREEKNTLFYVRLIELANEIDTHFNLYEYSAF